jgi:ABC-type uncharacterized transport system permease subunit
MYHAVRFLNTLLPLLYFAAVLAYGYDFFRREGGSARLARGMVMATLLAHGVFLVALSWVEGHVPLATTQQWMSAVALAIVLVYVSVEGRSGVRETGVFMLVLPFALQLLSSAFLDIGSALPPVLESPLFAVHTMAAVVGYAAFGMSATYSGLYLLLHRVLKTARFGLVFDRLPPLPTLARLSLRAAEAGVAALTLTIAFGTIWAINEVPGFARDPKFLLTVAVWVAYLGALLLHHRLQWSDRRTIRGCLVGFVLLVVAALANRLLLDTFHVFA